MDRRSLDMMCFSYFVQNAQKQKKNAGNEQQMTSWTRAMKWYEISYRVRHISTSNM